MIKAEELCKSFGRTPAVDGISLTVEPGRVLGLLGPNGAGKTTMIRMLATLIRPDSGRASVCGHDVVSRPDLVRRVIGLTGQYASVDEAISGWENLYLIGRLLNLSRRGARARAEQMLGRFDLEAAGRRRVSTYSGGMRRRLDLAASLVGEPDVLFLDEPTTGLDPRSRNGLWTEVRLLVGAGTTVLLTTQYMEEAEQLSDSVVVVDGGRVVASGSTTELRARVGGQVLQVCLLHPADLYPVCELLAGAGLPGAGVVLDDGAVELAITDPAALSRAVEVLGRAGVPLRSIDTRTPSLDEVFLSLTGSRAAG